MELPRRYWNVSFGNIKPEDSKHKMVMAKYLLKIDEMIRNGYGLLFWGDNNSGKTACASIILKEMRRRGFVVLFCRASKIKDAFVKNVPFDSRILLRERLSDVDGLVIDDLGKEYSGESGYIEKVFDNLIRERTGQKKITIITTNVSPDRLDRKYKKSMIKGMFGAIFPILVEGYDYRAIENKGLEKSLLS